MNKTCALFFIISLFPVNAFADSQSPVIPLSRHGQSSMTHARISSALDETDPVNTTAQQSAIDKKNRGQLANAPTDVDVQDASVTGDQKSGDTLQPRTGRTAMSRKLIGR